MATTALDIVLRARDDASKVVAQAGNKMTSSLRQAEDASKKFGAGLAVVGAAAVGLGAMGINQAAKLESLQIALETVTGSTEDAAKAMATIRRVAAESPFFETETLSQVIGKGRADVIDFRELVNAGWVSVRKDTAEAMGVTMAQFEEMVSAGEVGYDDIRKAAEKFTGSAQKQSSTWNALVQRMGESFQNFLANVVVDTGIFDGLKGALSSLIDFMDTHGKDFGKAIKEFMAWSKDNWPIVVGIILGGLVPALYGLATAVGAVVVSLAPFLLIGAAVGAIALLIMKNWGPISSFFSGIWNSIVERARFAMAFYASIPGFVAGVVNGIINWFAQLPGRIWNLLMSVVSNVASGMSAARNTAVQWSANLVSSVISYLSSLPGRVWGVLVSVIGAVSSGMSQARGTAMNLAGGLVNGVVGYISSLPGRIAGVIGGIPGIVSGIFHAAKNAALGALHSLVGGVSSLWGRVTGILGQIRGAVSSGIDAVRSIIPGFANGTNFAPGGLALVGERGPELVNLPRGSQVIPNHRLGSTSAGGFTIEAMTIINNTPTDRQAMLADIGWAISRKIA